jgi:hypothetical protein
MPPRMLKRGRPKGAGLTVIGLPKKRKVTGAIPFIKKSPTEKERGKLKVLMYNYTVILMLKGHWQPKFLLLHLKEHEKISRLAV